MLLFKRNNMKITLISFDHWNYDHHIVKALREKNIDAFHIKIGGFKHKNNFARLNNSFSKIFFNKNPKIKKRQDFILQKLKERGIQDQILVINPETIDLIYHNEIKKYTNKYMAYLYDSVQRNPIQHLLDVNLFETIYSFDKNDCSKYGFLETTNYIYYQDDNKTPIVYDYTYVGSIDDRIDYLNEMAKSIKKNKQTFQFFAIGKKATVFQLQQLFFKKYKNIIFKRKLLTQTETLEKYSKSNTIIDIVRENQSGLSFRIFEAMGLQKNILTNNEAIKQYDIFESEKVDFLNLKKEFSSKNNDLKYSERLIQKYSIENWVTNVFNLK